MVSFGQGTKTLHLPPPRFSIQPPSPLWGREWMVLPFVGPSFVIWVGVLVVLRSGVQRVRTGGAERQRRHAPLLTTCFLLTYDMCILPIRLFSSRAHHALLLPHTLSPKEATSALVTGGSEARLRETMLGTSVLSSTRLQDFGLRPTTKSPCAIRECACECAGAVRRAGL